MSIWQTSKWQDMLIASGQSEKYFCIEGIYIEKRQISLGEYALFVIGGNSDILVEHHQKLIDLCKGENTLFLQYETYHFDHSIPIYVNEFKKQSYKKFITPFTALIDLSFTQDEILSHMKPKGRYNIKLAKKKGVQVEQVKKTKQNIGIFYELMSQTTQRDNFAGNTLEYYMSFLKGIENSSLLFAEYEGEVIAAGIFVFQNDVSIYYYGASTSEKKYRNLMAPYLLQWQAIEYAQSLGSKYYDFLGVSSPDAKDCPLAGVTDFKTKLTSDVRQVSESYIYVHKKWKYFLIQLLRKLK